MYPPSSAWRVAAVDCPRVQAAAFSGARDLMNCASGRRAHFSWAPDGYRQLGSGDAAPGVTEVGDDLQFPAERADVAHTALPDHTIRVGLLFNFLVRLVMIVTSISRPKLAGLYLAGNCYN